MSISLSGRNFSLAAATSPVNAASGDHNNTSQQQPLTGFVGNAATSPVNAASSDHNSSLQQQRLSSSPSLLGLVCNREKEFYHAATRRLTYGQRFNTSVGSAIVAGMWRFNGSLNSCVNQILELEGSRMQRELAQIILTKHYNNASRMKLVKKHFYSEEVFSDSNPDKPYIRWRFRNIHYDDSVVHKSEDAEPSSFHEKPDTPQMKQFMRQSTADTFVDPLDFIFGHREEANTNMETSRTDDSTLSRRQLRAHKRARRRHQQAV